MSAKRTRKPSKPAERAERGRVDLQHLRLMGDAEIARTSPPELTDLPTDFWRDATLVVPVPKQAISLRVDEDVLHWFRDLGPRYQTRMNAVLRAYMHHAGAAGARPAPAHRRKRKHGADA